MALNADEVHNSASLTVDATHNCHGTGTHDFKSIGSGQVVKGGTTYTAEAYDQINNVTC